VSAFTGSPSQCCRTFEATGYHEVDCSADLDPRETAVIPLPPSPADITQMERDLRTAENAARVRAQTIAIYARQCVDAWPAVLETAKAVFDRGERLSEGDAQRIQLARAAMVAYTAAVLRLNKALET